MWKLIAIKIPITEQVHPIDERCLLIPDHILNICVILSCTFSNIFMVCIIDTLDCLNTFFCSIGFNALFFHEIVF